MIHICMLPICVYPLHFNHCDCSLFSFWRQWQCIIALSWQQGIVMELSSCTHEQMQNWLTLHNMSWIVRFLLGNADEHKSSLIGEQTYCRILRTLKISSSYKQSNAFSGWSSRAPHYATYTLSWPANFSEILTLIHLPTLIVCVTWFPSVFQQWDVLWVVLHREIECGLIWKSKCLPYDRKMWNGF